MIPLHHKWSLVLIVLLVSSLYISSSAQEAITLDRRNYLALSPQASSLHDAVNYPVAEKYYGVNAYGYCLNNPIRYSDPTGQKPKDVIMGGIIGLITNVLPMSGKLRDSYIPADKDDYNYGLQVADITSGVVGVIMIVSGEGGQAAGGGLVAVGAGVAATGIGAPEGGIVALGGTVAVAGGVVLEAGGMYILANSAENASGGYERGKSYSEKQKINHPAARKQKSINQMQKDIDSGRAPKGIKRFDKGHTKGGQPHVHFDNNAA